MTDFRTPGRSCGGLDRCRRILADLRLGHIPINAIGAR
jgi:hypothetical protein